MQMMKRTKSAKYLKTPTYPIQIDRDRSVAGLLAKMEGTSFQGRNLAAAHQVWLNMLQDNATVFMGLSGGLVAAGMRRLIAYLIKNHYIDVLVATGANLFHDMHETLGRFHYQGSPRPDDKDLRDSGVVRIYDTYASEVEFREADEWVGNFANTLEHTRPYSTRDFLHLLGRELSEIATEDGVLTSAYKAKVPIYCPAITDSPIGVGIAASRIDRKNPFQFDVIQDVVEMAQIVAKSANTGIVLFGGGSPKNYITQACTTASVIKANVRNYKYAVQIVSDVGDFGGLSGAPVEDPGSWGRLARDADRVSVNVDATIAMPLLVTALSQTGTKVLKQRRRPTFTFGKDLGVHFQ
jgi:deoxyhypusine synthase